MVDANPLVGHKRPSKMVFKPSEMVHRFSAKSDFIRYFKEKRKYLFFNHTFVSVQLYVPPDLMINKDFLRKILTEEKKLLTLNEKKEVNVARFDELSVKQLYPKFKNDASFMAYFPDSLPKGRLPDRTYFFNVMNTLYPEYTQSLIQTANNNRCVADEG